MIKTCISVSLQETEIIYNYFSQKLPSLCGLTGPGIDCISNFIFLPLLQSDSCLLSSFCAPPHRTWPCLRHVKAVPFPRLLDSASQNCILMNTGIYIPTNYGPIMVLNLHLDRHWKKKSVSSIPEY